MPLLSVLILSVLGRRALLSELLADLTYQIHKNDLEDDVEILVDLDDMESHIADKRNRLLKLAQGKMVVYVDDDDKVNEQYLATITEIIRKIDVDYIGYKVKYTENGHFTKPTYHSIGFNNIFQDDKGYYRNVAHINPIRADIAKQFRFPRVHRSEDDAWDRKIFKSKKLKREFFLDEFMYFYRWNPDTTLGTVEKQQENAEKQVFKKRVKDFDRSLVQFVGRTI